MQRDQHFIMHPYKKHQFTFTTTVEKLDFGRMYYTVSYLPQELVPELPLEKYPRLRIEGIVAEIPFEGALQPTSGKWYLLLSKRLLKDAGKALGDKIQVSFDVADQDHVSVPEDLRQALEENPEHKKIWDSLTPGRRRGFAHRVDSARRPETREHRILEILDQLYDLPKSG